MSTDNGIETIELPLDIADALHVLVGSFTIEGLTKLSRGLQTILETLATIDPEALPREQRIILPRAKHQRLTSEERAEIMSRRERGDTYAEIGLALGRPVATIQSVFKRCQQLEIGT